MAGCIRPATPGFIVTLVATILLAVVSFCVPYFKTIFFLKATIDVGGQNHTVIFGTLGYCTQNGTSALSCSKPSIGYELDINALVGNNNPLGIEIPQVAVKWITYALFLHVIALIGAAGSAVFGLLAHVREMSMACCSTFISGFAAVVAMLAFIFDLVLFFVAKARINHVGTATIGNAIWLTLAAWLLLFFSGCFYTLGRCCISKRPSGGKKSKWNEGGGNWGGRGDPEAMPGGPVPQKNVGEQLRLDAVKAEADRKARQKQVEGGLPAFHETQPLTAHVEGDHVYLDGEHHESRVNLASSAAPPARPGFAGGYVPGTPGTRTMDDYYGGQPQTPSTNTYPPQPHSHQNLSRQQSEYAPSTYTANVPRSPVPQHSLPPQGAGYSGAAGYGAATGYAAYNAPMSTSPPPSNQMLAPPGQYNSDPYGREYGHGAGGSSYHTASSQHGQQPSNYSQYDPYAAQAQPHYGEPAYTPDPYNHAARMTSSPPMPAAAGYSTSNPYFNTPSSPPPQNHPERSYTLGGDGYGANSVPPLQEHHTTPAPVGGYYAYGGGEDPYGAAHAHSPQPINTNVGYAPQPAQTSPMKGPRPQPGLATSNPDDSPPGYEPSGTGVTGNWGKR